MKIKTSELTPVQINWVVATIEDHDPYLRQFQRQQAATLVWLDDFNTARYATDWGQSGPIIEREGIATFLDWERFIIPGERSRFGGVAWGQKPGTVWGAVRGEYYMAEPSGNSPTGDNYMEGSTPLIAAMRCYVASKLGDEVEIPEALI